MFEWYRSFVMALFTLLVLDEEEKQLLEQTGQVWYFTKPLLEALLFAWIAVWNYVFARILFHWAHVTKPLTLDSLNIELFVKLSVVILIFLLATFIALLILAGIVYLIRQIRR